MPMSWDPGAFAELKRRAGKAAADAAYMTTMEFHGNITEESPVDQGRLQGSWTIKKLTDTHYIVGTSVQYALYQNEGTGLYGPKGRRIESNKPGRRIYAAPGKVFHANGYFFRSYQQKNAAGESRTPLAWKGKGGGMVFAMSTRGTGKHKGFVERAVAQTEQKKPDLVRLAKERNGL